MATIKHISSKNADYGAAERYLTFAHNELSGKPLRDAEGYLIPQDDYRIDTLLCNGDDFAVACMKANLRYGKNNRENDIKSHHYIISYDPRDAAENGLTVEHAQALGVVFCREHFPGHQAIIVTHPDGQNRSGNIHTHIVINSLRVADAPRLPYMDRACDTKAGMKHRCTAPFFRFLRGEVMQMCQQEGLHQIDLFGGAKNRITDKEYQIQRRMDTAFETDKETLRRAIRAALQGAITFAAFENALALHGISVKESRGRFSYWTVGRLKPITARKLGDAFSKEAVLARLEQNVWHAHGKAPEVSEERIGNRIDLESKRSEGKGVGYIRWAKVYNLKQTAKARMYFVEHGFESPDDLDAAIGATKARFDACEKRMRELDAAQKEKRSLLIHLQTVRQTQALHDTYQSLPTGKKKNTFYAQHRAAFVQRKAALDTLKVSAHVPLPTVRQVQAELETLASDANTAYQEYREVRAHWLNLCAVRENILHALRRDQPRENAKEKPIL